MSFEHPNRNNESMRDVELDIMSRPPEHNTTNLDLDRMNLMLDILTRKTVDEGQGDYWTVFCQG